MADLPNIEKNRVVVEGPSGTDLAITSAGNAPVDLLKVGGTDITLGQKAMSASVPVAVASDQTNVPSTTLGPTTQYVRIATNTTTVVKSGAGVLRRIVKSQGGTVTIYDNTSAAGTIIHTLGGTNPQGTIFYDIPFTVGLTIVTSSGPDLVVVYE